MIVEFQNKVEQHLKKIYKNVQLDTRVDILAKDLIDIIGKDRKFYQREINDEFWSEKDCMLISYGDSITTNQERPLQTLNKFIQKKFPETFSIIHILPFFPYSSDEGFSVKNYYEVY